jgi:putative ABC transport system ATP-binding protein
MSATTPIAVQGLNHAFGKGALRKQILFDISIEIPQGEIVIVTGPSGSGKTTLLTLVGALRSAQEGSVRVLGQELCGAKPKVLEQVRKQIGFIFQQHNAPNIAAVQSKCWRPLVLASVCLTTRSNYRAGSASGLRLPGPW